MQHKIQIYPRNTHIGKIHFSDYTTDKRFFALLLSVYFRQFSNNKYGILEIIFIPSGKYYLGN